ncbi:MAG: M20/M25/M40 family metallo-hydrolase [Caldilineaceae bacterium]|nr:M20/M25/M40 family metallo-hydrolase [Caldilineaceae bacterium]
MTDSALLTTRDAIRAAVNPQRLADTALALIAVPSPTRSAGAVADRLAEILTADGFAVERPVADWPEAPAVVVRLESGVPGRTLQFDGHLDTVHLPFVPPRQEKGYLYGSGASDMKGGIAAFVEALRVLRDTGSLKAGSVLLTAHDHHEGPWGDRRQVQALIREGIVGDGVLLPEYLADPLPVAARGMAIFEIRIRRAGEPVHEVLRPDGLPDVLAAGVLVARRLQELHTKLSNITHPITGHDSVFLGQFQCGEIFNQAAVLCTLKGTRRWVTPNAAAEVQAEFADLLAQVADETGTSIEFDFEVQGEAYAVDADDPLLAAFQNAHRAVTGAPLPLGRKPFVDDGNTFAGLAGITPLSHGPAATGAHTLNEEVSLADLVRVAEVYALTAVGYCRGA